MRLECPRHRSSSQPEADGWEVAVLVPGIQYAAGTIPHQGPALLLKAGDPAGADERVRRVQARLAALGIDPGPIDGMYGPQTAAAVAAFQECFGIAPDGEVGPVTWTLLFS